MVSESWTDYLYGVMDISINFFFCKWCSCQSTIIRVDLKTSYTDFL